MPVLPTARLSAGQAGRPWAWARRAGLPPRENDTLALVPRETDYVPGREALRAAVRLCVRAFQVRESITTPSGVTAFMVQVSPSISKTQ